MTKRAFISHVTEESKAASRLKTALSRDFLDLLDVFVSSDGESIAAGEEWLQSIREALAQSSLLMILCSPASIKRPWVNFEAGAAWMREIPIVPLCHAGLKPGDLPMPLSLHQGVPLEEPNGVRHLYVRVAKLLACRMPERSFDDLAREISGGSCFSQSNMPTELKRDRAVQRRLAAALQHQRFAWRTIDRVAAEAGITLDAAADLLRADAEVRFSKSKSGNIIVGLRSRVG